ncbi:unnamed protein product, partial [Ascophyllum nodosum]
RRHAKSRPSLVQHLCSGIQGVFQSSRVSCCWLTGKIYYIPGTQERERLRNYNEVSTFPEAHTLKSLGVWS